MEITVGMDGDIVIMSLNGDLVANTAENLKAEALKLSNKNFGYILLDMEKVKFMDSSGLGACIAVHKLLLEKKGMLVCAQPADVVNKVFRITRADKKLNLRASKREGLNTLQEKIIEDRKAR